MEGTAKDWGRQRAGKVFSRLKLSLRLSEHSLRLWKDERRRNKWRATFYTFYMQSLIKERIGRKSEVL